MTRDENSCVIEKKGVGEICVNNDGFSLSITDESREKARQILEHQRSIAAVTDPNIKFMIDKRISDLDDDSKMKTTIPIDNIKMVGVFPSKKDKDSWFFGISFDKELGDKLKLDKPIAHVLLSKERAHRLMDRIPKNIKITDRMSDFIKST